MSAFIQIGCLQHIPTLIQEATVMQNYTDSDYARNKNNAGIVYRFADGTSKELSLDDFLAEDPAMTEEEFRYWKQISDDDYYQQDRDEYNQTRKNVPYDTAPEILESTVPSPDDAVVEAPFRAMQEKQRRALGRKALDMLTFKQRKYSWMHHAHGMTQERIAAAEGIAHQTVSRSLMSAKKKFQKYLKSS